MITIHREGYPTLLFILITLFLLNTAIYFVFPQLEIVQNIVIGISVIIFLFFLQFFRNPKVKLEGELYDVIAPADGKVVVIEETEETEYLKDRRRQISIFMSPVNVHVNRNPISGLVKFVKYHPGKFLVAWHPKSSTENERTTMVVEHTSGVEILFRQIAGAVARRICWYIKPGQSVAQGTEFGFIKFGSRVDIFVPLDAEICVKLDEVTKGGRTIIARLPQKGN